MPQLRSSKPWEGRQRKMAQANVDLGLNTAAFTAGLNEAERRSQSFEGRIAGLFRRSPLQRAERAFGELGANLASGNVAQGLASFVGRITGFGLVTGAVVGAAIGVFQKFRGEITETTKAATELDKALAISGYASSAAQVEKSIEAISASIDAVSKKSGGIGATLFGKIAPRFKQGLKDELDAALAQFAELEAKRPRLEARRIGVKAEALMGSEREAELAATRLDTEEQIASIRARQTQESEKAMESLGKADPAKRQAAMDAIRKSAEASILNTQAAEALEIQKIGQKYDLKMRELEIDKSIEAQGLLGISADDQKISKLQQELALIQSQLGPNSAITLEKRKQLELAQVKAKAELQAALNARGPQNNPPIGIAGGTPQGFYDPNTGEFRNDLRPQETANLRAGQAAAAAALRGDQAQYSSDMREWQARYADYMRGADYYEPAQLKKPQPPAGYDVNPVTGEVIKRAQMGDKTQLTKEEFQSAMDAVMQKYWGN